MKLRQHSVLPHQWVQIGASALIGVLYFFCSFSASAQFYYEGKIGDITVRIRLQSIVEVPAYAYVIPWAIVEPKAGEPGEQTVIGTGMQNSINNSPIGKKGSDMFRSHAASLGNALDYGYVHTTESGASKIEGLPEKFIHVTLLSPARSREPKPGDTKKDLETLLTGMQKLLDEAASQNIKTLAIPDLKPTSGWGDKLCLRGDEVAMVIFAAVQDHFDSVPKDRRIRELNIALHAWSEYQAPIYKKVLKNDWHLKRYPERMGDDRSLKDWWFNMRDVALEAREKAKAQRQRKKARRCRAKLKSIWGRIKPGASNKNRR